MEALGIDGKLLLAQLINFGVFLVIFKKFMAKPFFEYIKKQQEIEKQKEGLAKKLAEDEAKMDKVRSDISAKAQKEAAEIIADAKETAKKIEEKARVNSVAELTSMKEQLKKQQAEEEKTLRAEVKKDVLTTSEQLVKAVLKDSLDSKMQSQILENLLKKTDRLN